jgi:hypothetical protein
MDRDKENKQSFDQPQIRKTAILNNCGHSYNLRNNSLYSAKEFKELETAYHEICEELDLHMAW